MPANRGWSRWPPRGITVHVRGRGAVGAIAGCNRPLRGARDRLLAEILNFRGAQIVGEQSGKLEIGSRHILLEKRFCLAPQIVFQLCSRASIVLRLPQELAAGLAAARWVVRAGDAWHLAPPTVDSDLELIMRVLARVWRLAAPMALIDAAEMEAFIRRRERTCCAAADEMMAGKWLADLTEVAEYGNP